MFQEFYHDEHYDTSSCYIKTDTNSNSNDFIIIGLEAMGWGALSAFSFPLGAIVSLFYVPKDHIIGLFLGFGNGALLCALSVDMFATFVYEYHELHTEVSRFVVGLSIVIVN